jgi:hypothetical protein
MGRLLRHAPNASRRSIGYGSIELRSKACKELESPGLIFTVPERH